MELVTILYEHAILSVQQARERLAAKDIVGRTKTISKAIAIIGELDGSLDHSVGGPISKNLARLYQYMRQRLTTANMKQEDPPLAEVESLLQTLAEAWAEVQRKGSKTEIPVVPEVAEVAVKVTPSSKPTAFGMPFIQNTEVMQSSHSWSA
jgi:flagellar protein FliS